MLLKTTTRKDAVHIYRGVWLLLSPPFSPTSSWDRGTDHNQELLEQLLFINFLLVTKTILLLLTPDGCLHGIFTCFIAQFTVPRSYLVEGRIRRPTEKWGQQKWKVTLMHRWSLGTSSESPLRGGEHAILLSLPIAAITLFHVVCHHTTCCSCVCWPFTNLVSPWSPEFVRSQIHQEH